MIEIQNNQLVFSFPEVYPSAVARLDFQRTLRIPDDGKNYPLPPGLGCFPVCHVDDYSNSVAASWLEHGGVMLPMYQAEALWLNFSAEYDMKSGVKYPFALVVATGKINAISGKTWNNAIARNPQNYLVIPKQPWLDGYCVEKGVIRQFVAMPLGSGYTAEEQITGKAEHGGLQIMAFHMKREVFLRRFPVRPQSRPRDAIRGLVCESSIAYSMGLAPGGRMKQKIYEDPYDLSDWDTANTSRCFVHIANSMVWRQITGVNPPTVPPTAKEYTAAGLPWFDWYDDKAKALDGTSALAKLKGIAEKSAAKKDRPLPENESVDVRNIKRLRAGLKPGQVREYSG